MENSFIFIFLLFSFLFFFVRGLQFRPVFGSTIAHALFVLGTFFQFLPLFYFLISGYQAIRMVVDGRTLRAIKARCSIYVDNDAPAFRIGEWHRERTIRGRGVGGGEKVTDRGFYIFSRSQSDESKLGV